MEQNCKKEYHELVKKNRQRGTERREDLLEHLRAIIWASGYTQKQISHGTGIQQSNLSNILKGKRDLTLKTLFTILTFLNHTITISEWNKNN